MRTYIDNDDLYRYHPHAHTVALANFPAITEVSYPGVEGWYVEMEEEGGQVTGVYEPVWTSWYLTMKQQQEKRAGQTP